MLSPRYIAKAIGALTERAIQEHLVKRVDQYGNFVEWKVCGDNTAYTLFDKGGEVQARKNAVAFIIKTAIIANMKQIIRALVDDNTKSGRPGWGGGAMDSTHPGERMNTGQTT